MCFVIMLTIKTWIWSRNIYYFYLFIIKNVTLFNNIDGFSFFIFNLLIVILDLKKNYLSYLLALPLTALIIREAFWFHFPEKIRKLHLEFLLFLSIHSVWHFIHLQDWLVSFHWTLSWVWTSGWESWDIYDWWLPVPREIRYCFLWNKELIS